jgi:hypothetical protein
MTHPTPIIVSGAVEGLIDEAVLSRLIHEAGGVLGPVFGKSGKEHLRQRMNAYNRAAQFAPWVVLVDLDRDADCAPPFREVWLPQAARLMCFRCAIRAVESWLLGDAGALAGFLGVAVARIPSEPEALPDPKRSMVELAQHSRRRSVRNEMVPSPGSGQREGPGYSGRMIEFAQSYWRPDEAAQRVDSLAHCRRRLAELVARARQGPDSKGHDR